MTSCQQKGRLPLPGSSPTPVSSLPVAPKHEGIHWESRHCIQLLCVWNKDHGSDVHQITSNTSHALPMWVPVNFSISLEISVQFVTGYSQSVHSMYITTFNIYCRNPQATIVFKLLELKVLTIVHFTQRTKKHGILYIYNSIGNPRIWNYYWLNGGSNVHILLLRQNSFIFCITYYLQSPSLNKQVY